MKFNKDRLLIIGSATKKCGKTKFICEIISANKKKQKIVAVKAVQICNKTQESKFIKLPKSGYIIKEEINASHDKDTARMLKAGAEKVYYFQYDKQKVGDGLISLFKLIPEDLPLIIESSSLRNYIIPDLYVLINSPDQNDKKESYISTLKYADKLINYKNGYWDFSHDRIFFRDKRWIIREQATAIVLAGGQSSRMEGADKSLLIINGKPVIINIISQLSSHFDEILIGAENSEKFNSLDLNIPVIQDIEQNKGPLMGILSCIKKSKNEINFITACDIPVMNIKLIHKMINEATDNDIVIPVTKQGKIEPLYAIYKKNMTAHIENLLQNDVRKIAKLFPFARVKKIEFEPDSWYNNLNKRSDYKNFLNKSKGNI